MIVYTVSWWCLGSTSKRNTRRVCHCGNVHSINLSIYVSTAILCYSDMEHAGICSTHVNNLVTTMNIPAVDPKLLRRQERVIGPVIEKVAQDSCDTATQDELSATAPGEGIAMSYDCVLQKKGRAINSLTGVGYFIGLHTKKILRFATRSKRCATCYTAKHLGKQPEPHDCRKNFTKSSKAMEADAIAEIGASLQTGKLSVQHLNKHCFMSSSVLTRHNMLAKSKQLLAELAVKSMSISINGRQDCEILPRLQWFTACFLSWRPILYQSPA